MKRTFRISALVFGLTATVAQAEFPSDQVISQLQAKGYAQIEVKERDGKVYVEAYRSDEKIEITYDAVTGAILNQELSEAGADDRAEDSSYDDDNSDSNDDDDSSDDDRDDDSNDDDRDDDSNDDSSDDDSSDEEDDSDEDDHDNDDDEDDDSK